MDSLRHISLDHALTELDPRWRLEELACQAEVLRRQRDRAGCVLERELQRLIARTLRSRDSRPRWT